MMTALAIKDADKSPSVRSRLAHLDALDPAGDWRNSMVFYRYANSFISGDKVTPRELGMSIALNLWARNHTVASTALSKKILPDENDEKNGTEKEKSPKYFGVSFGKSLNELAHSLVTDNKKVRGIDGVPQSFLSRVSMLGVSGSVGQLFYNLRYLVDRIDRVVKSDSTQIGIDYPALAYDVSNIIQWDKSINRDVLARWNREFWRGGSSF
jgi:hypothetical protein